ncbi:hypothetical protein EELLY_v1c07010 [Entomoplasma ellychniae]|uniref:Transmembrane protein n=1 Tax=Entomoplasma ellychniae TaxID=2114 RepID=A0A8E2UEE4_9MOLU|nr:hypothetical protein [Entomoplasma ellychniae]PPE05013.1 hypothetical protein EELLY_v1c07010 [Entomoplasma ellychniae]
MKLLLVIIFLIFNVSTPTKTFHSKEQSRLIVNNEKHYPTVQFNNEFIFRQEKLEKNEDLELGYIHDFKFKIKELEKYKKAYFSFQLEITFEENVTFNDNKKNSYLDVVKTEWTDQTISQFYLKSREYFNVNFKSLQITPEIYLTVEDDGKVTLKLVHKDFLRIWTRNQNIFKSRTLKIRNIKVSFKPKEELLFLENQIVELTYQPKLILSTLEKINEEVNKKIITLLKIQKVDPVIFNYFYKIENFQTQELNILNEISSNFRHVIWKKILYSDNIKKDTFFKSLTEPIIKIAFNQEIYVDQIGINLQLQTKTPKNNLNEQKVFDELFNQEIWFKEYLKIRKINTDSYQIYSDCKNIKDSLVIKVTSLNNPYIDKEILIPKEDLKDSKDEFDKENLGYETIKEKTSKNNTKSFILFAISISSALILCFAVLLKNFYVKFIKK